MGLMLCLFLVFVQEAKAVNPFRSYFDSSILLLWSRMLKWGNLNVGLNKEHFILQPQMVYDFYRLNLFHFLFSTSRIKLP